MDLREFAESRRAMMVEAINRIERDPIALAAMHRKVASYKRALAQLDKNREQDS